MEKLIRQYLIPVWKLKASIVDIENSLVGGKRIRSGAAGRIWLTITLQCLGSCWIDY